MKEKTSLLIDLIKAIVKAIFAFTLLVTIGGGICVAGAAALGGLWGVAEIVRNIVLGFAK